MLKVFVSYSRKDADAASHLIDDLNRMGHNCWHDQDAHGGQRWWDEICRNIRESPLFLQIVTEHSLASVACVAELSYADDLGKEIFPVDIGDVGADSLSGPLVEINLHKTKVPTDKDDYAALQRAIENIRERAINTKIRENTSAPDLPLTASQRLRARVANNAESEADQKELIADLRQAFYAATDQAAVVRILEDWRRAPNLLGQIRDDIDRLLIEVRPDTRENTADTWKRRVQALPFAALPILFSLQILSVFDGFMIDTTLVALFPVVAIALVKKGYAMAPYLAAGSVLTLTYYFGDSSIGIGPPLFVIAAILVSRLQSNPPHDPLGLDQKFPLFGAGLLLLFGAFFIEHSLTDALGFQWTPPDSLQAVAGLLVLFGWVAWYTALIAVVVLQVLSSAAGEFMLIELDVTYIGLGQLSLEGLVSVAAVVFCAHFVRAIVRGKEPRLFLPYVFIIAASVLCTPDVEWPGRLYSVLAESANIDAVAQGDSGVEEIAVTAHRVSNTIGTWPAFLFLIFFVGAVGHKHPNFAATAALLPVWVMEWLYQIGLELESLGAFHTATFIIPVGGVVSMYVGTNIVSKAWLRREVHS